MSFRPRESSSFIPVSELGSCHTGQDPSKRKMKAFPVPRHSKVLTTDAPYPHVDRTVVHLLRAVAFCEALPSGSGKSRGGEEEAMPRCCNYVTTNFAAPRPLTQLFREDIKFIVSCRKNAIFEFKTRARLRSGGPPSSARRMHASRNVPKSRQWL